MQPERQASESSAGRHGGRVAWSLLAVFLIVLPLVAVGRIMVATDDELADIRAQALVEMEIDQRTNHSVTYVSSFGWHQQTMSNTAYSLSYDCAVLKINTRITYTNIQGSGLFGLNYYGFWDSQSGGWDVYIGRHIFGSTINDSGTWDNDRSMVMNGLRIELAYDDIDSASRKFLFLRFGSDDQRGRFSMRGTATSGMAEGRYISFDGILDNPLEESTSHWADNQGGQDEPYMRMNYHRQTLAARMTMSTSLGRQPLSLVNYMDFGPGTPSSGRTDFYISIADTITVTRNNGGTRETRVNSAAFGPWNMARNSIPGRGLWMHFQRGYVSAEMSLW